MIEKYLNKFKYHLVVLAGIFFSAFMIYEDWEYINQGDEQFILDYNNFEEFEKYIDKYVIVKNACLADFSVYEKEHNEIQKEIYAVESCDTIAHDSTTLFIELSSNFGGSIDNKHENLINGKVNLYEGRLGKSPSLDYKIHSLFEKNGIVYDSQECLYLYSGSSPKSVLWNTIGIVAFILGLTIGGILLVRHFEIKKKKEAEMMLQIRNMK